MPRTCRYIALTLFVVTSAVWLYCWFNYRLLAREIWVYLFLYLVPAGLVWGSAWVMLHRSNWRRILGGALLIPSLAVWLASLLLVAAGFRIH